MNIFAGSLPYEVTESELEGMFKEFGTVSSVKIITDKYTGKSKGYGFIEMPDEEEAEKAIENLNGKEVDGRNIVVSKAEGKKDNTGRGGFGKGRRRDGYYGGKRDGGYHGGDHKIGGGHRKAGQ
ncbi:MAG: RNA-binding protein [Ignavibacteria bacterium]|nr:RNA-binding protein [Ignavibacteria bacterium]